MKNIKFYPTIWQTIPYSFELIDRWDNEGKQVLDMVLKNKYASEKGVSEMLLNTIRCTAFDTKGREHFIAEFPEQFVLNLKGLHTGLFVKSKSVLKLSEGEYTTFRFYLNKTGNVFSFKDRSKEMVNRFDYLDFEIENGLNIDGEEAPEAILRFDFTPYTFNSYFKSVLQIFKRPKLLKVKLANSLEN
tara:strand:+ start:310173 stop:310736 length:564 start_codon:yes stop_codon:yes gene_type:complete